MEEKREASGDEKKKSVVNHFEAGSNCQVFNGNVTGCTFAMPGAAMQAAAEEERCEATEADNRYNVITLLRDNEARGGDEAVAERFHFVHPSLGDDEERLVHEEVKRLVRRQGIQGICAYLKQMAKERRILLPPSPASAYAELVRMGMPSGEGFSEKTFQKHYRR